jgi:hypothetical protein
MAILKKVKLGQSKMTVDPEIMIKRNGFWKQGILK